MFIPKLTDLYENKATSMIDREALDKELTELIENKIQLSKMDYNNDSYDELEEKLHDREDRFLEHYGDFLEDAFHEVHDEFCPDSDVLLPIAYLPNNIIKTDNGYDVEFGEGVYVDVDDYASSETKLVLLPQPTRIILQVNKEKREVVWQLG